MTPPDDVRAFPRSPDIPRRRRHEREMEIVSAEHYMGARTVKILVRVTKPGQPPSEHEIVVSDEVLIGKPDDHPVMALKKALEKLDDQLTAKENVGRLVGWKFRPYRGQ